MEKLNSGDNDAQMLVRRFTVLLSLNICRFAMIVTVPSRSVGKESGAEHEASSGFRLACQEKVRLQNSSSRS